MNKRLIKWQIREWLPEFFILFVVFGLFVIIGFSDMNNYRYTNGGVAHITVPTVGIINIPAIVFSTIAPLVVYDYRYKKTAADTFYQLPLKKNEFRNTRILIGLIMQILVLTFFYIVMVLMVIFKQKAAYNSLAEKDLYNLIINKTQLIYYLPYYFVLIGTTCINYFSYCFIANLANRRTISILYILMFYFITSLFLPSFFTYRHFSEEVTSYTSSFALTPSPHGLGNVIYNFFQPLLNGEEYTLQGYNIIHMIVILSLSFIFAAMSFFITFILKDPSGEEVGSLKERYRWTFLIPHVFFFTGSCVMSNTFYTGFDVMKLLFYCLFAVACYLTLCLMRKKFKITIVDIILIASSTIFGLFW